MVYRNGESEGMNNLEYLKAIKDSGLREHLIKYPDGECIGYRKTIALEIIAECMLKSNEMAKEALDKSNKLYGANMAMKQEKDISIVLKDLDGI